MRFISMKHFKSPAAIKRCVMNRETIVLGQIIGEVNGSLVKMGRLPDGSEQQSIVLLGDFAGICYEQAAILEAAGKPGTGAEFQAESLYMPKWYAEAVVAKLANNKRIEFAAEIIVAPTPEGQTILYQYDVKSLIARPANSPVERMKRVLSQNGVLKLSAPQVLVAADMRLTSQQIEEGIDPDTGEVQEAGFPEPIDTMEEAAAAQEPARTQDEAQTEEVVAAKPKARK